MSGFGWEINIFKFKFVINEWFLFRFVLGGYLIKGDNKKLKILIIRLKWCYFVMVYEIDVCV